MSNYDKQAIFLLCFFFVVERSAGLFNGKTVTAPSLKIFPDAEGNFIHFQGTSGSDLKSYIDSVESFQLPYKIPGNVENVRQCDFNNPPTENSICYFDVRSLGSPCSRENNFGFHRATPCVFFTLSQVLDWTPVVLNGSDIQQHSDPFLNIPDYLKDAIACNEKTNPWEEYIWLTCEGDMDADKESIGPVSYYPQRGFPTYYFPYKNIKGYQSPIVAVQFERPQKGVVINIICKSWAKNIVLDERNELGFLKFQLLIE